MLADVGVIAQKLVGTTKELPPHIEPVELVPWGVERCETCRVWTDGGQIKNGSCTDCRKGGKL